MSGQTPAAEMQRALVLMLRSDDMLSNPGSGLLFPRYSPQADTDDLRVYGLDPELPNGLDANASRLPRLLIEVMTTPFVTEQIEAPALIDGAKVYIHIVARLEDEQLADQIDARVRQLCVSTSLSSDRIIAPRLVPEGQRRRGRITEFNGAWEFVSGFAVPLAGSLQ